MRTASTRWLGAAVLVIASFCAVATRAVAAPAYIGRVAGTQAAPVLPTSSVTLTASRQVAGGDALLIALKLSTSLFGGISATDAAGNTYRVDIDQADGLGLGRTIVISATNVRALAAGASITVNFPMSGAYMISVDEFSGLAARDVIASASGNGSTFSSGMTPTTSQPIELLFGAVGNESGAAAGWSAGWTGLPTLTLGGDHLGAAYRVTSSAGAYAASGSTSGTWMAGIAAYTAADSPPTARLTVTQLTSPALSVRADGSGSTDGDATPIASYRFDFGDGSAAVTTTAPTATTQHTYAAAGTYTVTLIATDTGGNASTPAASSVTVNNANRAPTLSQPANMTVNEGATADQTLNATDPDGNALTFSLASGPTYASVTTTTPGTGTATGNLHLAPGFSNAGTAAATVRVSDGSLTDQKSLTITVNNVNRAPTLNQPANMSVVQGATADQAITGSDPDGNALTFSKVSGPAFMTVTTTNATAGNIHLAPGASEPAGTSAATVRASDGSLSNDKTLTINVTAASTNAQVAVYVGYYDTHHYDYLKPKPNPWRGSPNVVFVGTQDGGTSDGWDTSALRVDNLSGTSITVGATVDIGSHHYALWSPQTVPAGWAVILAQTALENFDGSDTNPAGCYGCNPDLCTTMVSHTIPVVNLTVNGVTTAYPDSGQVLNTNGADAAGCPATGTRNDESHAWQQIQQTGVQQQVQRSASFHAFEAHGAMSLPVPNPTRGDLTVRLNNPARGAVRVGVYNVAGRLVLPCVNGVLEAGDYNMQINLRDKPAGLYWLVLTTREGTTRRKFVYVR
jgi:PKD repeat protein